MNVLIFLYQNTNVQAFVYAEKWKSISGIIVEGGLYLISNFYIQEFVGSSRPTNSKIVIRLCDFTTVEKIDYDDQRIPFNKFDYVAMGELFRIANETANVDTTDFSTG